MEKIVQYMCKQLDGEYSGRKLLCTKEYGENCICISGHILNYLLCGFLYHNKCISPPAFEYRIKWVCENEVLFPIVMLKDGRGGKQYIGTKAAEPGCCDYKKIGRQQCDKPIQESFYLKLEKTKKDLLNRELLFLESNIHDYYVLRRSKTHLYHKVMLSLAKAVRNSDKPDDVCFAQNCLLLFFAQKEISTSLEQYLQGERDRKKCCVVLSFLAKYCAFVVEFLPLYQNGNIPLEFFRRCFYKHWRIEVGPDLVQSVIRQDGESSTTVDSIIPAIPFLTVSEFEKLVFDCIHIASYIHNIKCMKRLSHILAERCTPNDGIINKKLENINQYIRQMQDLKKKEHSVS